MHSTQVLEDDRFNLPVLSGCSWPPVPSTRRKPPRFPQPYHPLSPTHTHPQSTIRPQSARPTLIPQRTVLECVLPLYIQRPDFNRCSNMRHVQHQAIHQRTMTRRATKTRPAAPGRLSHPDKGRRVLSPEPRAFDIVSRLVQFWPCLLGTLCSEPCLSLFSFLFAAPARY
ncbi:hypothetical protein BDN72DRAFT_641959 [Pluteus cervinus]|uniref:Uncharacterized protein n=1 Tax=Pluteus cervinus TaxID=181527 RepID=A0ACD3A0G5_9AGAR|nr:hypothetical protein BDN72DRAFT_641959 [Pluteus cervinus]